MSPTTRLAHARFVPTREEDPMARLTPPDALREAADELRRQAADLGEARHDLGRRAEVADWRGARADAYRRHHQARLRMLDDHVARLGLAVTICTAAAAEATTELATLRRLETEARGAIAATGGAVPMDLPPTGDTRWREIHAAVTARPTAAAVTT